MITKELELNLLNSDLPAQMEEKKPLSLNLQFFAEQEEQEEEEQEEEEEETGPTLNELLKDKAFKKDLGEYTKTQLDKRMKKYEGVDVDEYRALKAAAEKGKGEKKEEMDDEKTQLQTKLSAQSERLAKAEAREKRAMVKEYAIDKDVNPKLLARLMDIGSIELDEDGDPVNLDDLFDELEEEFPEFLSASEDDDELPEGKKKSAYVPGHKTKKQNKSTKPDKSAIGKSKAQQLYGKKEEK